MQERQTLVGRSRPGPAPQPPAGAPRPGSAPQPPGPTRGRRRRSRFARFMRRLLAAVVAVPVLGFGLIWAVPPLHQLAIETVATSGHSYLARLIATQQQYEKVLAAWLRAPRLFARTPVKDAAAHLGPAPAGSLSAPGVRITPIQGEWWRGWLVEVAQPSRLHVVLTRHLGVRGQQVSGFARASGVVLAVNGGGFQDPRGTGTGGLPIGVTAVDGRIRSFPDPTADYVIGLTDRNELVAGSWTAAQARALGVRDAVSFKPLLIVNGKPMITQGDGGWGIGPRTAMGQRLDGTVLFVVIDGRQPGSPGATLRQVQDVLLKAGAYTAANLDGGSSTTLWFEGHVLNHPCCSPNGERYIPTAWVLTGGAAK
jgi:exopolysaccharide biosynthesis protein